MDNRQLAVFVAVMDRGSITEAARTLGVTQPAVSSALSKLEEQIGFALFRREGRGVLPTAEARQLYPEAARALRGMERLSAAARGISEASAGSLVVASHPAPAVAWLPRVAAAFRLARPDVRLRFDARRRSRKRTFVKDDLRIAS